MNDQSKRTEPKDPRIEAALRDYLERVDRGEPVDREEFLAQHIPIANQLRSFIAAEEDVRKLAAAEAPHDQARDSTKSFAGHGQETVVPQLMAKRNILSGARGLEGRFGRYRIIRALGKGAMGTVYLAEDSQIERQVALKTPHFTEDPTGEQMERFFREARAAGNLRHPNICPIYDFGQIDGRHFITMAYIEGRPLSAFIQPDNQQAERQILLLVRKLASALQEAHDHGVVHRDLKPANIMVDKKGEPIIMDFGLAQQARREGDIRLTQTGNIIGTPAYMSPEQVEGEPEKIGPPTDQYSLGVILYELLTGELPFRGSIAAVMGQILTKEPSPPSQLRPDLDARIEAVCLKIMAKNPAERFRSLKAAADEISNILKSASAKTASKPASSQAPSPAGDRTRPDAGASQVLKSLKQKTLTEKDLESLEELARKCYSRRDFEQVIQIIERIPQKRRNAALRALLEKSRGKADEISFLICDIDEAERLNDRQRALKKAEELLKIKPAHHRAREIQEKFAGYGGGGAARTGLLKQFTQPWNEGGWIPWGVLTFGLAVFGVMAGIIIVWLGRTAVVIDAKDPGITVAVNEWQVTINVPGEQSIKVEPGAQMVKVSYADLETVTKSFTLEKGKTRRLTVRVLDNKLVADLEGEITSPAPAHEEKIAATAAPTLKSIATLPPMFKNSLGIEFVLVPKGKSWLGGGSGRPGDKEVVISHDFYLGKYEVTQEEWENVTGQTPSCFCRTGSGKDQVKDISNEELKRFPVEQVSWDHAQLFLEALNKREKEAGWVYRLPKEAEWEYACRDGPLSGKFESAYDFYVDKPTNQLLPEQANFWHDTGLKRTCKVGSYQPNRLGLYDMHGNAHEWCDDTEKTADGASRRVHRGGGWNANSEDCRAAGRGMYPPSGRDGALGLRVARVPVGKEKEVVTIPPEEKQTAEGPEQYWVKFDTTKGDLIIEVHRDWSPYGADRFYELVKSGFYDRCKFFRVAGFVVQFGISGDPHVSAKWHGANIPDDQYQGRDPNRQSNKRGYVTFAKTGMPNSRTTQIFINRVDNAQLDRQGFTPFGVVLSGMQAIDSLYSGYGEEPTSSQDRMEAEGDAYFNAAFPKLDSIKTATILPNKPEEAKKESADAATPADTATVKPDAPDVATKSSNANDSFVPLFNGHDLTGWKTHPSQPGNWRVENGLLVGSGPGLTSHLYTERGDFKDFHLRVEARINDGGNSGVYYRTRFGPVYPARQPRWLVGYNAKLDDKRLGAFLLDDAGPKGPIVIRSRVVAEPPAGQWIVLEVLVRGNHIVIKTDGEVTAEYTDKKRHFASGYIALQQHTPQTRVEFRKIEIKELPLQSAAVKTPAPEMAGISRAEAKKEKGEEFLAANAKKKGVRTLPSGLQYVVVKKGTGKRPKETDEVEVHYRGTLIDGTVFDNSVDGGEPASFRLNRVIPGWTEALQLMKEGAKWRVFIPSKLAYGQRAAPPKIGPNETLIFEIELLRVK